MPTLFVAGAGTDVGKTYVTASLIHGLRGAGMSVEALKPVVSGFDPDAPEDSDPWVLLQALGREWSPEALAEIAPWRFRAPLSPPLAAAREGARLLGKMVIAHCRDRAARTPDRTWLLVESAGGVMSPLDDTQTMLDLAVALEAPVLLVAGSYLGTISHTLTAAAVIKAAGLAMAGVVMSDSCAGAPPLEETVVAVSGRLQTRPVIGLRRGCAVSAPMLAGLGMI
jgi:dethiobiotin synthetase